MKTLPPEFVPTSGRQNPAKPQASLILGCGVLLLLSACNTAPESHMVSAPPPPPPSKTVMTTTTTTSSPTSVPASTVMVGGQLYSTGAPASAPVVSTTVITQAPPTVPQEPVLIQPSAQHVWIPGFWTWRAERYEWFAGHWEVPPSNSSIWVTPRWVQEGNAYRFYEGYWQ